MRQVETFYFYSSGEVAGAAPAPQPPSVVRAFRHRMRPGQRARTRIKRSSFVAHDLFVLITRPKIAGYFTRVAHKGLLHNWIY